MSSFPKPTVTYIIETNLPREEIMRRLRAEIEPISGGLPRLINTPYYGRMSETSFEAHILNRSPKRVSHFYLTVPVQSIFRIYGHIQKDDNVHVQIKLAANQVVGALIGGITIAIFVAMLFTGGASPEPILWVVICPTAVLFSLIFYLVILAWVLYPAANSHANNLAILLDGHVRDASR